MGVHLLLNRETRDGLSTYEKDYLHEAFQYTGGGLALTALAARGLFTSGAVYRIMATNPCKIFYFVLVKFSCSRVFYRDRFGSESCVRFIH